jgi:uncharacterized iron-regulated membrane protein
MSAPAEASVAVALVGEHGSGGAVHLVLLTAIVVIGLAVLGVVRWRGRRAAAEQQKSSERDRSAESRRSIERK